MKANRAGRSLAGDEAGAFPVVEAILVAVIVLSAILFFTSIQRPTTGSEVGGLDLGQFAADTLQVLESREFNDLSYPDWVTELAIGGTAGATTTATEVDEFISEVLPSGAEYSLRITNGVVAHPILPTGDLPTPNGANAAEVVFVPSWATYAGQAASITVAPGEVISSTDATRFALVSPGGAYRCLQAPNGNERLRDGPDTDVDHGDSGTAVNDEEKRDFWWGHWHAAANVTTGSTGATGVPPWRTVASATAAQVPADIPLGTWRLSATSACSSAAATYINVVPPECLATPTASQCSSPYAAYGLQLVVWFGA